MLDYLVGSGIIVLIVATIMKLIKSKWKPDTREFYILPAFGLSALLVAAVMLAMGTFDWIALFVLSTSVTFAQGFIENDLFAKGKELWKSDEIQEQLKQLLEDRGLEKKKDDKS